MTRLLLVTLGGILFSIGLISAAGRLAPYDDEVRAWVASNLAQVSAGSEDWWYNYDFNSRSVYAANVDWPIRYLFAGYAEVDNVKDRIDGCGGNPSFTPCLGTSGSKKYFFGVDNGATYWDEDGGRKAGLNCQLDYHIRVYANPANDQNYSPALGFYILGSVHSDYEWLGGTYCTSSYYSTEATQAWFDARARAVPGWTVASNVSNWLNYEAARWADGTHYVESDGYTTYVTVR